LTSDQSPIARTRHGELTLDQLAEMMPGMARLMGEISDRYWLLYYAAQAGNWELARHEFSEMRKALQMAGIVRPKYRESLDGFAAEKLTPIEEAIRAKDRAAFEPAYQASIEAANELHVEFGYPYIVWQLPETPPPHLRLS
jgi:hypothetical protein